MLHNLGDRKLFRSYASAIVPLLFTSFGPPANWKSPLIGLPASATPQHCRMGLTLTVRYMNRARLTLLSLMVVGAVLTVRTFSVMNPVLPPRPAVPSTFPTSQPSAVPTIFVGPAGRNTNTGRTDRQSLATLARAIDLAQPGDVIQLQPGTYYESIVLSKSGTAEKPITIQARSGTAFIDGLNADKTKRKKLFVEADRKARPRYITLAGLTFRNADDGGEGNHNAAVRTGPGWHVQDCVFEMNGGGGLGIWGNDVVVERCIAQDNARYGIGGTGSHNLLVRDCISRRNNRKKDSNGGGGKFTRLDGAVIENYQSYDNIGVGIWFDAYNINVVLRGCEIHHNRTAPRWNKPAVDGDGVWLEISGMVAEEGEPLPPQPRTGALIAENNFVHDNDAEGILVYASLNVTVRNNKLANDTIYLKDGGRDPFSIRNLTVTGNSFTGGNLIVEGIAVKDRQDRNFLIDGNIYRTPGSALIRWGSTDYKSLDSVQADLGFEKKGAVEP